VDSGTKKEEAKSLTEEEVNCALIGRSRAASAKCASSREAGAQPGGFGPSGYSNAKEL